MYSLKHLCQNYNVNSLSYFIAVCRYKTCVLRKKRVDAYITTNLRLQIVSRSFGPYERTHCCCSRQNLRRCWCGDYGWVMPLYSMNSCVQYVPCHSLCVHKAISSHVGTQGVWTSLPFLFVTSDICFRFSIYNIFYNNQFNCPLKKIMCLKISN